MDGETLLLTLIALREQARSEEEYDAAVAALVGESAPLSIEPPPARVRATPTPRRGVYRQTRLPGRSILLSVEEHYGSEPPGEGWTYSSEGRWVKVEEPPPERTGKDALRVAVVGGGPGGLFTTYLLNQLAPQLKVTLFEASDRLGGKILTEQFSDGSSYEAGVAELYEYLGPGGKDPLRLLIEEELHLETHDMTGGVVVLRDEILHDLDCLEDCHGKPTRKAVEAFHKKMVELMPLEKYANRWQPDKNHPWGNKTFLACVLEELKDDAAAVEYVLAAVHSDLATAPHTCNGLNGIKNVLMDNPDYMRLYHIEGGIGRLAEALEEAVTCDVHLGAPVSSVHKRKERYRVEYLAGERQAHADFDAVVLCMPNHWLSQLKWDDSLLRARMLEILARYDLPAHYLRVTMLFDHRWWEHLHIDGHYWMMDCMAGVCCYDESRRWNVEPDEGHVLSFLIPGEPALLLCSNNQTDEQVVEHLLRELPACMALTREHLVEYTVNRWAGSLNAQPGGFDGKDLIVQHTPEPKEHPGLFLCMDFVFDSTLNAALISARTAVDLLVEHLGVEAREGGAAAKQLASTGGAL